MPDQVNFTARFASRPRDRLAEPEFDEQVRTFGIEADAGKIRPVADPPEPGVQFHQVDVSSEKAGYDDHPGVIAARDSETVVDRRRMQQQEFNSEKRFRP